MHTRITLAASFTDIQGDKYSLCCNSHSKKKKMSSEREIPDVYHISGNTSNTLHMLTRNRIIIYSSEVWFTKLIKYLRVSE